MLGKFIEAVLAVGRLGTEGLRAQAKWEMEVSRRVLARRKKILFAALLPVGLLLCGELALAAALPETIGGHKAYMPALVTTRMFLGSILVGLLAGLITGVIGAGGGYILTPALMSFGVKGIMAVGTDQFHLFAKAIMGTTIHRKLGNINLGLAVWFMVGSAAGVTAGGVISRRVYNMNPSLSDSFINIMYVVILGVLGFYALADWMRLRRETAAGAAGQGAASPTTRLARWLQGVPLKPRISFDENSPEGAKTVSVYPVIFCGLVVGVVSAIMGVGGGFLTFPMFVYGMGVSTFTTVGTSILQILFTAGYSSIAQYAFYGFVFYTVAMGMLLGSLVGVQIGAMVTATIKGSAIRAFYAITILAGFVNRLAALPRKLSESGIVTVPTGIGVAVENVGIVLFFGLVGFFGAWVLWSFFKKLPELRGPDEPPGGAPAERTTEGTAAR